MGTYKPNTLPLIPLPYSAVLFPGVILRVFISDRQDITALLAKLSNNNTTPLDASSLRIGCIPLKPPTPVSAPIAKTDDDKKRIIEEEGDEVEETQLAFLNIDPSSATPEELFSHGTTARVVGVEGHSRVDSFGSHGANGENGMALVVEGVSRFRVKQFLQRTPFIEADVEHFVDQPVQKSDVPTHSYFTQLKALSRELVTLLRLNSSRGVGLPPLVARRLELLIAEKQLSDAGSLADFMVSAVETTLTERLQTLSAVDVPERLEKAVTVLTRQVNKIKSIITRSNKIPPPLIAMDRRNGFPLPGVSPRGAKRSPGFGDTDEDGENDEELDELSKKIGESKLSPEAQRVARREMQRLRRMSPAQAEYGVCRTYLETLTEIPWSITTEDQLDASTLARARKQLNDDHYGLEAIKKRLLEYLAVLRLKRQVNLENEAAEKAVEDQAKKLEENAPTENKETQLVKSPAPKKDEPVVAKKPLVDKSPILLLVGPPGVGKTSLARSVATALGRKFHRISLGGVRDEAEIRGHRRTYVAAMPGLIVNALKKVAVANPVILLDEIDKIGGANFHGDPSAAMLEVLDPEQNWSFTDHYINIPIDLSKVLFIATANSVDTIPPPLLDRMERIQLSGYTSLEKMHIASQYLIPKQLQSNGLAAGQVELPADVLSKIITSYTRESGVRNLEREIGSVCRSKAVEYAEAKDAHKEESYKPRVEVSELEDILGIEKYYSEIAERCNKPGVVTGLVAFSIGSIGSILFIEAEHMPGSGRLQLTGKLGEVIKESVEVALTWVKAHAYVLGLTNHQDEDLTKNRNVHVHCPAGAVPKDGPSAGVAFTIAMISMFSGRRVSPTLAMTGEVSLRGRVTPVGGIKEKLIGALTAGVKTVLLPAHNRKEVRELPEEVKNGLEIIYVRSVWEALKHVWPEWTVGEENMAFESRL
ncbi:ATP-dependent protease La [Choiromyces venosus 120613-1]|uniref:Lon protease homolog 2, peroxisomal n=1 Tax=Choiromyces venosus 120613-1 TaxID=1336337 RepID=A0A3N4J7D9_9PEZI|nr:ATP-dependent protease La [Choiromyces venosus 120613-1]